MSPLYPEGPGQGLLHRTVMGMAKAVFAGDKINPKSAGDPAVCALEQVKAVWTAVKPPPSPGV
jgi:hypothetical protein